MSQSEKPLPHARALAHLGDAVYELWVREAAVSQFQKSDDLHRYTVQRVKAEAQGGLLDHLLPSLSEAESDLVRRAQNMPVTTSRRSNQAVHRKATAFEALIGYWYLAAPEALAQRKSEIMIRLEDIYKTASLEPGGS
jgi:ribonuclease III family protein